MHENLRALPVWATDWPIAYMVVQAILILLVVVICAALMSFVERRLLGLWQDRYGPNRVGPFGSLQIVADMLKIMFKEDWTPKFADKLTFRLAPAVAMATAVLSYMVIPVSPFMGVADMSIGLLFFMAMAGIAVYAGCLVVGLRTTNMPYLVRYVLLHKPFLMKCSWAFP